MRSRLRSTCQRLRKALNKLNICYPTANTAREDEQSELNGRDSARSSLAEDSVAASARREKHEKAEKAEIKKRNDRATAIENYIIDHQDEVAQEERWRTHMNKEMSVKFAKQEKYVAEVEKKLISSHQTISERQDRLLDRQESLAEHVHLMLSTLMENKGLAPPALPVALPQNKKRTQETTRMNHGHHAAVRRGSNSKAPALSAVDNIQKMHEAAKRVAQPAKLAQLAPSSVENTDEISSQHRQYQWLYSAEREVGVVDQLNGQVFAEYIEGRHHQTPSRSPLVAASTASAKPSGGDERGEKPTASSTARAVTQAVFSPVAALGTACAAAISREGEGEGASPAPVGSRNGTSKKLRV